MDFKDSILQLAKRVSSLKESIQTEEATKNAFIMPFIQILGYDVFNPLEVVPEMDCDITKKKGLHVGSSVPYGYRKAPNDYHYFIIDDEAADNIRNIFKMYLSGKSKTEIANYL